MVSAIPNATRIQEKLEQRILHGLACEWENALWVLDADHRKRMHKPIFSIRDMNRMWGRWSPETNEIRLSRQLVLNHGWDAVVDVLRHEMAHQFTAQVLDITAEAPHGPGFRHACQLLRANPGASGSYPLLDQQAARASAQGSDRLLARVQKLMALAESRNPHEAEAAMAKAHELVAKYNIDLIAATAQRDFISIFIGRPALRHFREEYHLAHLLHQFYFIEAIWVSAYVLEKGRMGRVLEISGTPENVQNAGYVFDFVHRYIDSRWTAYNRSKGLNRYRKSDFAVGIIEGFSTKLQNKQPGRPSVSSTRHGLVRFADPQLQRYMQYRHPRTASISRKISHQDAQVLNDGIAAGKKMVIYKGIHQKSGGGKYLTWHLPPAEP